MLPKLIFICLIALVRTSLFWWPQSMHNLTRKFSYLTRLQSQIPSGILAGLAITTTIAFFALLALLWLFMRRRRDFQDFQRGRLTIEDKEIIAPIHPFPSQPHSGLGHGSSSTMPFETSASTYPQSVNPPSSVASGSMGSDPSLRTPRTIQLTVCNYFCYRAKLI